jgi:hypothetical protein
MLAYSTSLMFSRGVTEMTEHLSPGSLGSSPLLEDRLQSCLVLPCSCISCV